MSELDIMSTAVAPASLHPALQEERLLILIPAFNEEGRIGAVVRDVRRVVSHADVLVIDDGSLDETGAEAVGAGAQVLRMPINSGYGAALQAGHKHAVRQRYTIVGQLDGDGQHPAENLPKMLQRLVDSDADVIIGSRFLDDDGHYRPSAARKVGIAMFSRIASSVMRQHVSDPTSGYQVMRIAVAKFFSTDVYPSDYPDADILILLHRSGFRVGEVGVQMRMPTGKSMHSGHRSLYYVYKMWLSIVVTLLRKRVVVSR